MKKLTAFILSALLMLASVPCMAEGAEGAEAANQAQIHVSFFAVTASLAAQKNYGELTARITKVTENTDHRIYAIDQKTGEETETGFLYTFQFTMPENAESGTYLLSVGGAYAFTQEFSYYNIMEKVNFYNALHAAPVSSEEADTIFDMLSGDSCKASYDFTLYKSLAEDIRLMVDAEIDALDLSVTQETVAEAEKRLTDKLDALIPLAVLLNVSEDTDEATLNSLVAAGKSAGVLDDKGYSALPYEYVLKYLLQNKPEVLEEETVSRAFSEAVLLATVEVMDAYSIVEIFDYYLEKDIVSVNAVSYASVAQRNAKESLFAAVKEKNNSDIPTLEGNVNAAMTTLLGAFGSGSGSGGGSGSGSGGFRPSTGGAGFSADAQNAKVEAEGYAAVAFRDLGASQWAAPAIEYLAAKGILAGREEGVFAPNEIMSREELVKLIVLAFNGYDEQASANFTDVAKDRWSYPYIASAYQLELVAGVSETEFAPTHAVTRQDMATILYRILEKTGYTVEDSLHFADADDISAYARAAVAALVAIGAINGMGDGTFAPKSYVTRAQAAKVVYETMQYIGGDAA